MLARDMALHEAMLCLMIILSSICCAATEWNLGRACLMYSHLMMSLPFHSERFFWRSSDETITHHRNSLFNPATGVTVDRVGSLDWLHCLSLGTFQTYCSFAWHALVECDAWQTLEHNQAVRMVNSVNKVNAILDSWTKAQNRGGRQLTDCGVFKQEQFGSAGAPTFNFKGGETNTFLEFLVTDQLPRRAVLAHDGPLILQAGEHLMKLLTLIRVMPWRPAMSDVQRFHHSAKQYLITMRELNVAAKPKDHMLMHLAHSIPWLGSPSKYGNWVDESLNRLLRDVASGSHAVGLDKRTLLEFERAYTTDIVEKSKPARKRRR